MIPYSDLQVATPMVRCRVRKFRNCHLMSHCSRRVRRALPSSSLSLFPLIVARPVRVRPAPARSLAALLRSNQFSPGLPSSSGRGTVSDLDRVDQRSLTRMDRRFKPKWLNLWHPFASHVSGYSTDLPIGTLRTQFHGSLPSPDEELRKITRSDLPLYPALPASFRCQIYHSFNQGKKRQIRERESGGEDIPCSLFLKVSS